MDIGARLGSSPNQIKAAKRRQGRLAECGKDDPQILMRVISGKGDRRYRLGDLFINDLSGEVLIKVKVR